MSQKRNKTGISFEKKICQLYGWQHVNIKPIIKWSGDGRNNFEKIKSLNFDTSKMIPNDISTYDKYDAIDQNGRKIEIKKYFSTKIKGKWLLYSEPFFKVSNKEQLEPVSNFLGDGDLNLAKDSYNKFIEQFKEKNIPQIISESIFMSNDGIQLQDKFITKEDVEFKIEIKKNCYKGFDRLTIFFKIKS